MKFILLFGPPAVGKMSVGQELTKITNLKLFHNHMTIELVIPFFDFGTKSFRRLVDMFREEIFKEVAKSNIEGLIFTFVWAFNVKKEEKYVDSIIRIFKDVDAKIFYVELESSLEERLKRNKTFRRQKYKPTKRDLKSSEERLLEHEKKHSFNTKKNEFSRKSYLKINNTNLSAKKVASSIKREFNL